MGVFIYALCAMAALGCAMLLFSAYRRTPLRLLLWSAVCFMLLTINNILIVVDLILFPEVNLFLARNVAALSGMVFLLYGLIWDSE